MHEALEKKSAGTVRQTGSSPAELPQGAIPAPGGIWWQAGRSSRHQGKREGGASFDGLLLRPENIRSDIVAGQSCKPLEIEDPLCGDPWP